MAIAMAIAGAATIVAAAGLILNLPSHLGTWRAATTSRRGEI
jgi:hypothetical protein